MKPYGIGYLLVVDPSGRVIVRNVSFTLGPREVVILAGKSGAGKTSVFRAIAGVWPSTKGSIKWNAPRGYLILPSEPFIYPGTLDELLCYPHPPPLQASSEQIRSAFRSLELHQLLQYVNKRNSASIAWPSVLSRGEGQRIQLCRALLHR